MCYQYDKEINSELKLHVCYQYEKEINSESSITIFNLLQYQSLCSSDTLYAENIYTLPICVD